MIVALNNKSNLTKQEFNTYQNELNKITSTSTLILCPSTLNIANFNLGNFHLGAQNVSKDLAGAHTGEISASQLSSYDVEYCIVGHSERRKEQQETTQEIAQKIKNLLKENIKPILCIGETLEEKKSGQVNDIIEKEINAVTELLNEIEKQQLIVAYEPIWSIGTGIIPTNEEISVVIEYIKQLLPMTKVLYGGSANEKNIDDLKNCSAIDGYLLGGLSLKPSELKIFLEKLEN